MAEVGNEEEKSDKSETTEERLKRYKERFKVLEELWSDNRKAYIQDIEFKGGKHWPEDLKTSRENDGRPCLVVDKLNQYIRQVVNDGRQNRPSIDVDPVGDGDKEVAEAHKGLIRHVLEASNADDAFDSALDCSVSGGYGFFRVVTEYVDENTFNQEPRIQRITDPTKVLLGEHIQADGSDAPDCFIVVDMPKEEFKRRYPKAKETIWEAEGYKHGWSEENTVRVCEYFHKEEEPSTIHLLEDGTTIDDETYQRAIESSLQVPAITQTREISSMKVEWCRMSGAEILEEEDWLGKYIPVVLVVGNELNVEGKVTYSGLTRAGKDAQRLYDYSRSGFAEVVAYTSKNPYIGAEGQFAGHPEWDDAHIKSYSKLEYTPTDTAGAQHPPPRREPPIGIPEGFARDMQMSEHDIQGALGMYASSLGQRGNATSGKQELAQIREADTGTFHYIDNLAKGIRFLGRILIDLNPKVIDSKRAIRLLQEDGTSRRAMVDPNMEQPVQHMGALSIYNLNAGTYDVVVKAGPSYTTKREEERMGMMELVHNNPQMWQTHGDLIAQAQDWPNADKFAQRSILTLPPPIQQAIMGENSGDPKVEAVKQQAQQMVGQLQEQIQAAEQGIQQRDDALKQAEQELAAIKADREAAMMKAQTDQFNAETTRMKAIADAQNSPKDNTDFEQLKLQYEDSWKKLEAETKVLIAQIQAEESEKTANASVAAASAGAVQPVEKEETGEPDTKVALMVAIQGFTAALEQMRQPRQIIRDAQGRAQGIQ